MKKIVVIDNDEYILKIVKLTLEFAGYQAQTSLDGSYLQQMQDNFPDLIMLDNFLGDKNGQRMCHQLKVNESTKHIPVILFSAHALESEVLADTYADGFLAKPFHLQELLDMVQEHI